MIFIDLEATGRDPQHDRITEIAIHTRAADWSMLVNPERPIPEEIVKLTGVSDAMVADAMPFRDIAATVAGLIDHRIIAGYGITRFDIPLLARELEEAGVDFDWTGRQLLDVGALFMQLNPRRLQDAAKKHLGRDHVGAHRALADATMTAEVFWAMHAAYPDLTSKPIEEIASFSTYGQKLADPAGKLTYIDGRLCYAFGPHKGTAVEDDLGFAYWILNKDFPASTRRALHAELGRIEQATRPNDTTAEPTLF